MQDTLVSNKQNDVKLFSQLSALVMNKTIPFGFTFIKREMLLNLTSAV